MEAGIVAQHSNDLDVAGPQGSWFHQPLQRRPLDVPPGVASVVVAVGQADPAFLKMALLIYLFCYHMWLPREWRAA